MTHTAIEMVGVEVDRAKIICQNIVPDHSACTPTTFLNALRFGPSSFQKIFADLPGNSDKEKLMSLIATLGSAPSAVVHGRRFFEKQKGVLWDDMPKFFNAILPDRADYLIGTHLDIAEKETPAEHLRRIHGLLVSSLHQQVPVIASIGAFAPRQKKIEALHWQRIAAHTILIVRVPVELAADVQGFVFQFAEPLTGELCEGYIYTETVRAFHAIKSSCEGYIYSESEGFEPIKGSYDGVKWIDNGFLNVVSPSLVLGTQNEPWHARTFVALSYALGKFPFRFNLAGD